MTAAAAAATATPRAGSSGSSHSTGRPLVGTDGDTVIAAASHHLPPPIAGYTFLRHLRSTLSHDTFVAQRRAAQGGSTDLFVVRVHALEYLRRHEQRRHMVEREVLVGRAARHPNVTEGVAPFATKTDLYTVERYYSGGELFESVESYYRSVAATGPATGVARAYSGLPVSIARRIFRELVAALRYLHDTLHLAHRNLKLENVLLDEANSVRLSGLGMCAATSAADGSSSIAPCKLKLCCGSKHYVAPELLDGQPYDGAGVDVWAAGVVLFALVTGSFPFDVAGTDTTAAAVGGDDELFSKIRNASATLEQHSAFRDLPDPLLQDLLRGIFQLDVAVRLSLTEVQEHPFLRTA